MDFRQRVYSAVSKIPRGKVSTYADVALAAGSKGAARAVGSALAQNKNLKLIPCYRVVRSDGSIGNYSGRGGLRTKRALLGRDGMRTKNGKILDFRGRLYKF